MRIANERALIRVFNKAFSSGIEVKTKIESHGTTITKQIQVGEHGLNVGFYYKGGNMNATPKISTVIPKLNPKR